MVEGWQEWAVSGAAWLLTYLIHSTLLIAAVWLIARRLERRPAALDALWKTALVGGLVTATLQTAAGVSPWGGRLDLAGASRRAHANAAGPKIELGQISSPALAGAIEPSAEANAPEAMADDTDRAQPAEGQRRAPSGADEPAAAGVLGHRGAARNTAPRGAGAAAASD